jgi:quercetin dioxygenase-like cupin family protein
MSNGTAVVVDADSGEDLWFGGGLVTFKITSAQSGGAFVLLHDRMPRGKTTPLHLHPSFDETVYVLEGELLVHIDGADHAVGTGATASIPRGVPHALLVTSEEALILAFVTPGEVFEQFFREGGDVPTSRDATPPPLDIEKVRTAGERTGAMQVLGAPPFAAVRAHR